MKYNKLRGTYKIIHNFLMALLGHHTRVIAYAFRFVHNIVGHVVLVDFNIPQGK